MLILLSLLLPLVRAEVPPPTARPTFPEAPLSELSLPDGTTVVLTADHQVQSWAREGTGWKLVWSRAEPDGASLFLVGERVWVERHTTTAAPVEGAGPGWAVSTATGTSPGSAAAVASASRSSLARGAVSRATPGVAVVDLGRRDGLRVGSELRFLRAEEVPGLSGEGSSTAEREVGTGTVSALEDGKAKVDISRGSRVEKGDLAEPAPTGRAVSPLAPERLGDLGEAGVILRPTLPLDTLGVAFVNEAWASWTFDAPWYAEVRLSPAGFGWSQDGNAISVAAVAAGGLDNRWFSVGLGAGWSMLNQDVSVMKTDYAVGAEDGGGFYEEVSFQEVDRAFSLAQQARLGPKDGVSVTVRNTFVLVPEYSYDYSTCVYDETYDSSCVKRTDEGKAFAFGGIAMRFTLPVGQRTDLFGDWGTGKAGATWVTGGVSTWIRGNGDRGSLALEVAAGYGEVVGSPNKRNISLGGPLVSAGVRWRFGVDRDPKAPPAEPPAK
jgi:hypothetical protein